MTKEKKAFIFLAITIGAVILIAIYYSFQTTATNTAKQVTNYTCSSEGAPCTFTFTFSTNESTVVSGKFSYNGLGFYSELMNYMLRPGTQYSCSGSFYSAGMVNGWYKITITNHPWDSNYFLLSADKKTLRAYWTSYSYYEFKS